MSRTREGVLVRVKPETKEALKRRRLQTGVSTQFFLEKLIEQAVNEKPNANRSRTTALPESA